MLACARPMISVMALAGTALTVGAAAMAAHQGSAPSHVTQLVAFAFLPYAILVAWPPRERGTALIFAGAGAAVAVCLFAPPIFSDDLFRYLWDARVLRHGINPYRYAPADPALAHLRDALFLRINNPEIPTIYPPGAQLLFLSLDVIAHAPVAMQAGAGAAHLLAMWLVGRAVAFVSSVRDHDPEASQGLVMTRQRALAAYGLNPLALSETALNGHVDIAVGIALLCVASWWSVKRPLRAAGWLSFATSVKLVGLVLAPLLFARGLGSVRKRWAAALVLAAAATVSLYPVVTAGAGSETTGGLGQYARRWRGNEGGYALVEWSARAGLQRTLGMANDRVRLEFLRPWFERAEGTPFDPRASLLAQKKYVDDIAVFQTQVVSELLARVLCFGFVMALACFFAASRHLSLPDKLRYLLIATLLLAPQVHPWYLLWLLPLEAALGRSTVMVWSAAALVAYAPLDSWRAHRVWVEHSGGRIFEYAAVGGMLFAELASRWIQRPNVLARTSASSRG